MEVGSPRSSAVGGGDVCRVDAQGDAGHEYTALPKKQAPPKFPEKYLSTPKINYHF